MSRAAGALIVMASFLGLAAQARVPVESAPSAYRLPDPDDTRETNAPPVDLAQRLLTPLKRETCAPAGGDAIVVCGHNAENDRQKMPVPHEIDTSRQSGDGTPRAPNVSGLADCSRGCIGFGGVPPPMYFFDVRTLPEAPAGSDADRIARGEIRAP